MPSCHYHQWLGCRGVVGMGAHMPCDQQGAGCCASPTAVRNSQLLGDSRCGSSPARYGNEHGHVQRRLHSMYRRGGCRCRGYARWGRRVSRGRRAARVESRAPDPVAPPSVGHVCQGSGAHAAHPTTAAAAPVSHQRAPPAWGRELVGGTARPTPLQGLMHQGAAVFAVAHGSLHGACM
jgi:hypothetical protein